MAPRIQNIPAPRVRLHARPAADMEAGPIHDNAKRSVSIRINTSDYGRIKAASRRLRTREADLFRYLLQVGLARIGPLLGESLEADAYLRLLAEMGPDMAALFGLSARELASLVQGREGERLPLIDGTDFELINLMGTQPALAREQLKALGCSRVMGNDGRTALLEYLERKYLATAVSG